MRTQARFPDVPQQAGHYESFYLKLVQPGGGRGAWIRHTVHKRPGEDATCALWFVLFDSSAAGPRATKRQFGADELSAGPDTYIRIAEATLTDGHATGRVATDVLESSWDLSFEDGHEPFHHLPRDFLYRSKLPKTKFLSPYPDAVFNGVLEVGGDRIEVDGWRGMIGHNWGAEHAERWVWIQGSGFEGHSPEDYFDMAVGRIKVAGRTTPWVGNAMLMLDGRSHRLGGFGHVPSTEVNERPTGADFELKGKGAKVTGNGQRRGQGLRRLDLRRPGRAGAQHPQLLDLRPACWTSRSTGGRPSASPSGAPPPTSSGPGTSTTASRSSPTRTAETRDRLFLLLEERPGVRQAEGGRELRPVDRRRAGAADQVGLHDPRRGAALRDHDVAELAAQPSPRIAELIRPSENFRFQCS